MGETKKIKYGEWSTHPGVIAMEIAPKVVSPVWKGMATKHEGTVLYYKYWNFWVRAGVDADTRSNVFFRDYETATEDTDKLLKAVGFPWRKAESEEEIWERIGLVWAWLGKNVHVDNAAYSTISSVAGEWPSINDYARYYVNHGNLVWAACFSKAHLFATLLGRMAYPRFRFAIAEAHHAENGAPPTATHVFVAAYVADRWFYFDPTATQVKKFPAFSAKKSIGVDSFTTVDYEHPYAFIPVPLSGLAEVAYLPP